jgi:uncharacterized membrane protein YtjA (UPF0391 family)
MAKELAMFAPFVFLILAIIAGAYGYVWKAAAAATLAKFLFFVFLILFAVSLYVGLLRRRYEDQDKQ